jgi:hypothetical protein
MAFTVIGAQARSMLIAVQVPDLQQFKLWPEVVMTTTFLNNLVPVILNGEARSGGSTLDTSFLFGSRISECFEKQALSKRGRKEKSWTGGSL